jgi:hypothetical protein
VPHSRITKSLEFTGISNKIISFTKKSMSYWKTSMHLYTEGKLIQTEDKEIQCGIFQADSLSPLLFCISLIPLTQQLNKLNTGHEEHTIKAKVSHLLYTHDLKLIAETEEELQKQMQIVRNCNDDTHTKFGLDEHAKIVFKKEKQFNHKT